MMEASIYFICIYMEAFIYLSLVHVNFALCIHFPKHFGFYPLHARAGKAMQTHKLLTKRTLKTHQYTQTLEKAIHYIYLSKAHNDGMKYQMRRRLCHLSVNSPLYLFLPYTHFCRFYANYLHHQNGQTVL